MPILKGLRHDRRFDDRFIGGGLICILGDVELEVLDISVGGMRLPLPSGHRNHWWRGVQADFTVTSTRWPDMKPIPGRAEIRAVGPDWMAAQFVRPSFALMKCVSRHVAELVWGDRPYGY